ncbi:MAG: acetoin utilization protein AcuC [Methanotrichaceae archaeon]|nr:acetoin utilization protein AcuC [Methanotrichaceae archaeon]
MIYLYYSDSFLGYDFGPEHPLKPVRMMLAYKLIEESGLLDGLKTLWLEPSPASEMDLNLVHTLEYIESVKSEIPDPAFGLGTQDTPVFKGIYEASCLLAGGSIDGARKIAEEDCQVFNLGGGLHHAMPTLASGFCVFNDCALAICVLKKKFDRVLYIDIDGHHGDGVQNIFYDDPTVLTLSLHESGKYLFPGTGFVDEVGVGLGRGYSVNLPMPMYSGNEAYIMAFDEIVPSIFEWFKPQVVVGQLGIDTHYSDPLTSLNVTMEGYAYLVKKIIDLTNKYSKGRLLALGGGGYSLEVVPLAWTSVLQLMRNEPLPQYFSPYWVEMFINIVGGEPLYLPDIEIKIGKETKKRINVELAETLGMLKDKLSNIHGIF